MSYSISAKGADKASLLAAFTEKFETDVVAHQPIHANDKNAAVSHLNNLLDVLDIDSNKDIVADAYGSIGWNGSDAASSITTASGNVSVYQVERT